MSALLALPVFGLALMAQSAILSRLTLLSGCADLLLLLVAAWAIQERVRTAWQWAIVAGLFAGYVSALPWFTPLAAYLLTAALGRFLTRRLWQAPLLTMFVVTLAGTFLSQALALLTLQVAGRALLWGEAFNRILLPSALLNLMLAIPVYIFTRDLASLLYPEKVET